MKHNLVKNPGGNSGGYILQKASKLQVQRSSRSASPHFSKGLSEEKCILTHVKLLCAILLRLEFAEGNKHCCFHLIFLCLYFILQVMRKSFHCLIGYHL